METARKEAEVSLKEGGIPIGAVLVRDNKIISKGHNKHVQRGSPFFHAVIECLQNAGRVGNYSGTTLYVTLMPCYMCAGAIVQFGIKKIVVADNETFQGAGEFLEENGIEIVNLNLKECKEMLNEFIGDNPLLWNEDIGCS